ncbi:MAG: hypothetical protein ACYTG2_17780 [Planctomycetota bacterium]|jgi:hypothetical protein
MRVERDGDDAFAVIAATGQRLPLTGPAPPDDGEAWASLSVRGWDPPETVVVEWQAAPVIARPGPEPSTAPPPARADRP